MQWCCQLLQSVAKSRAEFYFVQRFAQQKNCEANHVTLFNSPATCLAIALQDKLLRKLRSVTGPLFREVEIIDMLISFFLIIILSTSLTLPGQPSPALAKRSAMRKNVQRPRNSRTLKYQAVRAKISRHPSRKNHPLGM